MRVLLFQDSGLWIAEALEVDVCAQGTTRENAAANFEETLALHRAIANEKDRPPYADVEREPPSEIVEAFDHGTVWEPPKRKEPSSFSFRARVESQAPLR